MSQVQQLIGDYFFVSVPEDAKDFDLPEQDNSSIIQYKSNNRWNTDLLPHGQYSLIGLSDELDELDCRPIVEQYVYMNEDGHHFDVWYKDYEDVQQIVGSDYSALTAVESFHSLLKSKGLTRGVIIKQVK